MKLNLDQAYSNGGKQADLGNIIKLQYIGPGFLQGNQKIYKQKVKVELRR